MQAVLRRVRYNSSLLLRSYCEKTSYPRCTPCNPCKTTIKPCEAEKSPECTPKPPECTPKPPECTPKPPECAPKPPECTPCVQCPPSDPCTACVKAIPPKCIPCVQQYHEDYTQEAMRKMYCRCCSEDPCGSGSGSGRNKRRLKRKLIKYTFIFALLGAAAFTCICRGCEKKEE